MIGIKKVELEVLKKAQDWAIQEIQYNFIPQKTSSHVSIFVLIFLTFSEARNSLFSPERKLYLLHNGTDSPQCGSSPAEACASFSRLLDVFYAKYTAPLDVTTDMSITIDGDLQVRSLLPIPCSTFSTYPEMPSSFWFFIS